VTTADLPAVNATLNGLAACLLAAGYYFIRRKQIGHHKICMVSAVVVSAVFLASYLTYHALHGSTKFTHSGTVRYVYFVILITHVILAAVNLPMVIITFNRAIKGRFEEHRRIARWTWPIWMYVSVTGVVVYLMLYQIYPAAE
jgi:putative membrane protein